MQRWHAAPRESGGTRAKGHLERCVRPCQQRDGVMLINAVWKCCPVYRLLRVSPFSLLGAPFSFSSLIGPPFSGEFKNRRSADSRPLPPYRRGRGRGEESSSRVRDFPPSVEEIFYKKHTQHTTPHKAHTTRAKRAEGGRQCRGRGAQPAHRHTGHTSLQAPVGCRPAGLKTEKSNVAGGAGRGGPALLYRGRSMLKYGLHLHLHGA